MGKREGAGKQKAEEKEEAVPEAMESERVLTQRGVIPISNRHRLSEDSTPRWQARREVPTIWKIV